MYGQAIDRLSGRQIPIRSWVFTVIAVATIGYVAYRYVATQPAEGEITAFRPYCELISCHWGKCNSRRNMACEEVPDPLPSHQFVRHIRQAQVQFTGRDGQSRTVWEEQGRLGIGSKARIGDSVSLHYIDGFSGEPEVAPRPNLFMSLFGIAAFLFFLSIGARMKSRWR